MTLTAGEIDSNTEYALPLPSNYKPPSCTTYFDQRQTVRCPGFQPYLKFSGSEIKEIKSRVEELEYNKRTEFPCPNGHNIRNIVKCKGVSDYIFCTNPAQASDCKEGKERKIPVPNSYACWCDNSCPVFRSILGFEGVPSDTKDL